MSNTLRKDSSKRTTRTTSKKITENTRKKSRLEDDEKECPKECDDDLNEVEEYSSQSEYEWKDEECADDRDEGDEEVSTAFSDAVACIPKEDVLQQIIMEAKGISEIIEHLPLPLAMRLLQKYRFSSDALQSAYWEDTEKFRRDNNLIHDLNSFLKTPDSSSNCLCRICFEDRSPSLMFSMGCDHFYCTECWLHFLQGKIDDGDVLNLTCMDANCPLPITDDICKKILPSDVFETYQTRVIHKLIDSHPRYRLCQGKDCPYVLMIPQGIGPVALQCKCGTKKVCSYCKKESHSPCNCQHVLDWLNKEVDDNMTLKWIKDNTKTCPKCSEPIEKNGGCNHMKCAKCKHDFCWLCSKPWLNHYACNIFRGAKGSDFNLKKYLHYWNRYNAHRLSEAQEEKIMGKAEGRAKQMLEAKYLNSESNRVAVATDVGYIITAAKILGDCRHTLKWTYVFAYYLPDDSKEKSLLEFMQNELELNTELLSGLLERKWEERLNIVNQSAAAARRLQLLLEGCNEGLVDSNHNFYESNNININSTNINSTSSGSSSSSSNSSNSSSVNSNIHENVHKSDDTERPHNVTSGDTLALPPLPIPPPPIISKNDPPADPQDNEDEVFKRIMKMSAEATGDQEMLLMEQALKESLQDLV